jgi:hypothetical protein
MEKVLLLEKVLLIDPGIEPKIYICTRMTMDKMELAQLYSAADFYLE